MVHREEKMTFAISLNTPCVGSANACPMAAVVLLLIQCLKQSSERCCPRGEHTHGHCSMFYSRLPYVCQFASGSVAHVITTFAVGRMYFLLIGLVTSSGDVHFEPFRDVYLRQPEPSRDVYFAPTRTIQRWSFCANQSHPEMFILRQRYLFCNSQKCSFYDKQRCSLFYV